MNGKEIIAIKTIGGLLILTQYIYIPFEKAIEIRKVLGPVGWMSLTIMMIGFMFLVIPLEYTNLPKKDVNSEEEGK